MRFVSIDQPRRKLIHKRIDRITVLADQHQPWLSFLCHRIDYNAFRPYGLGTDLNMLCIVPRGKIIRKRHPFCVQGIHLIEV